MKTSTLVLIILGVVAIAVAAFLIIRRVRYLRALKAKGWAFESSPQLESVLELGCPPFDVGFSRKVDDAITGTTTSGVPFRVFDYDYRGGGPEFSNRVALLRLPFPLPELYIADPRRRLAREGVRLPDLSHPSWLLRAVDGSYARTLLNRQAEAAIGAFAAAHTLDLGIDGNSLVAVGAPKDPDELQVFLDALAGIVTSLDAGSLQRYVTAPKQPRFGFYGHPEWVLVGTDDSLIDSYGLHRSGGFNDGTRQLVRGNSSGFRLDAFVHTWQTRRTETYRDSKGRTRTRTVTENHSENVLMLGLGFSFPYLALNQGGRGERVQFESEEFNNAFQVRTEIPKFGYDVIHPLMMEFLQRANPPGFAISNNLMRFFPAGHDTTIISGCLDFAADFFDLVPDFVWKDLGVGPASPLGR